MLKSSTTMTDIRSRSGETSHSGTASAVRISDFDLIIVSKDSAEQSSLHALLKCQLASRFLLAKQPQGPLAAYAFLPCFGNPRKRIAVSKNRRAGTAPGRLSMPRESIF